MGRLLDGGSIGRALKNPRVFECDSRDISEVKFKPLFREVSNQENVESVVKLYRQGQKKNRWMCMAPIETSEMMQVTLVMK